MVLFHGKETIIKERKRQIREEFYDMFGEYLPVDERFSKDMVVSTYNVERLIEYFDWEIREDVEIWVFREISQQEKIIRLLSEYIILSNA